jgi:putative acetyltransferase
VLDLSGLMTPEIMVWTAWAGNRIAAIGALKLLSATHGEIKSMRTHPDFLRQGAGAAILDTIIAAARSRGLKRLSLETGTTAVFTPALALYRRRGFVNGPAFADYPDSVHNQYLHRDLADSLPGA